MSEQVLIPDVYRRAAPGLGDNLQAAFREHLGSQGNFEASVIDTVLQPLQVARAIIIGHQEIQRLHRKLGIVDEIGEDHISRLAAYVQEGLPLTQADTLHPDSWPIAAIFREASQASRKVLTIGQSKTSEIERKFGQNAIRNFYELPKVPRGVWLPDTHVARVAIMRSRNQKTAEVYDSLDSLLRQSNSPLPGKITLEPVRVDADSSRRS